MKSRSEHRAVLNGIFVILLVATPSISRAFYNPEQGRWLSRDPVGGQSDLQPYRFAKNGPTIYFDALGQDELDVNLTLDPIGELASQALINYYAAGLNTDPKELAKRTFFKNCWKDQSGTVTCGYIFKNRFECKACKQNVVQDVKFRYEFFDAAGKPVTPNRRVEQDSEVVEIWGLNAKGVSIANDTHAQIQSIMKSDNWVRRCSTVTLIICCGNYGGTTYSGGMKSEKDPAKINCIGPKRTVTTRFCMKNDATMTFDVQGMEVK